MINGMQPGKVRLWMQVDIIINLELKMVIGKNYLKIIGSNVNLFNY